MGKLLKYMLTVFAGLIALVMMLVLVLSTAIDPNDFKPEIEAAVYERTGRKLKIEDDLELSLFPWLGITTGRMTLGNNPDFGDQPFASITASDLKVKLFSLLSSEVEVRHIVLKGLVLNLAKDSQGRKNWENLQKLSPQEKISAENLNPELEKTARPVNKSLKTAEDKAEFGAESFPEKTLAIGGISIENAQVLWDDQKSDKQFNVANLQFDSEQLIENEPVPITLSFVVDDLRPGIKEAVNLTAKLMISEHYNHFVLSQFQLQSVSTGDVLTSGELAIKLLAHIEVNLSEEELRVSELQLLTDDFHLAGDLKVKKKDQETEFQGQVLVSEFNPRVVLPRFGKTIPPTEDETVLSSLNANFRFQGADNALKISDLSVKLDATTITGSADITDFSKPAISFDLMLDEIDADRYLPVKDQQAGKVVQNKKPDEKPAVQSVAESSAAKKIASPEGSSPPVLGKKPLVATSRPITSVKNLDASGQVLIKRLKLKKLHMQSVKLNVDVDQGVFKSQHSIKQFYQGSSSGSIDVDMRSEKPVLTLQERFSQVQVKPLLKDLHGKAKLSGTLNATTKMQGRGNDREALKKSLKGHTEFDIQDGVIYGFNLHKIIAKGEKIVTGESRETGDANETAFSEIKGKAKIKNGLIKNEALTAKSKSLRVSANGTANLVNEKLDYEVNAKIIDQAVKETEPEFVKRSALIDVGGTFSKPSYKFDIRSLMTEQEKQKLYEKVDKKLGKGVSDLLKKFLK